MKVNFFTKAVLPSVLSLLTLAGLPLKGQNANSYYSDGSIFEFREEIDNFNRNDFYDLDCGCNYDLWNKPFRAYIDHVEGKWLDNSQGYTSLGVFKAFPNFLFGNTIAFIDMRGHFFNNGPTAANLGIGLRHPIFDSSKIIGVNAFYDYRKASPGNFHQVGIGFEFLGECWDFRLNGYIPVNDRVKGKKHIYNQFIGDYHATCQKQKDALAGVDFEIGSWLKRDCSCESFDLYAAIGGHFYHKNRCGPEIRLAANFARYLTLEVRAGYDRHYGGMAQGTINLSFPITNDLLCGNFSRCLCSSCNESCVSNIYQPVNRQEIIALDNKECCWTWNWDTPCRACK